MREAMWVVAKSGSKLGPLSEDEVRVLLESGEISEGALAWKNGMPEWIPLHQLLPDVPPPLPLKPAAAEGKKSLSVWLRWPLLANGIGIVLFNVFLLVTLRNSPAEVQSRVMMIALGGFFLWAYFGRIRAVIGLLIMGAYLANFYRLMPNTTYAGALAFGLIVWCLALVAGFSLYSEKSVERRV